MFKSSSLVFLYMICKYNIINQNLPPSFQDSIIHKKEDKDIVSYQTNEKSHYSREVNNKYSNLKRKLSSSKKNLILGIVTNYKWKVIQPFFKSFEAVGFENCDCVVFVSNIAENTTKKIESCGVIVKYIPKEYEKMIANQIRFKLYSDYLKENLDKYNLVLHVDIRDSIFQKDFFQFFDSKKPFLGITVEDGFMTEYYNKKWFLYSFGEEVYKRVEKKRILCSGTIWGTADKFLQLVNIMWEKVQIKNGLYNKEVSDQPIFNYIIYIDKIFDDCIIKTDNKDGIILTLGLYRKASLDS